MTKLITPYKQKKEKLLQERIQEYKDFLKQGYSFTDIARVKSPITKQAVRAFCLRHAKALGLKTG